LYYISNCVTTSSWTYFGRK